MRLFACIIVSSAAIFAQDPTPREDVKLITIDKLATEPAACSVPLLQVKLSGVTASPTPQVKLPRIDATPSGLFIRPAPPIAPPCTDPKTVPPAPAR